jgi:hypothetical protein
LVDIIGPVRTPSPAQIISTPVVLQNIPLETQSSATDRVLLIRVIRNVKENNTG